MNLLPSLVLALSELCNAWVVGSAANPLNNIKDYRDIDMLVPLSNWKLAQHLIPKDAVVNSFGGWKCKCGDVVIDVWPGELSDLMLSPLSLYAWQPKNRVRLIRRAD